MADVGFVALLLALVGSLYSATAFIIGSSKGYVRLTSSARIGVMAVCGLISLAAYALYYALLSHDFQFEYVYSHTSRDMPLVYNISAFWAGNAGSLLLMSWLLSLASLLVIRKWKKDGNQKNHASSVVMATLAFLLLLMILAANPFEKHGHSPSDGLGLNPLLENPGMVIHPPLLLTGYIAFTIPFAFTIAALITRNRDSNWLSSTRTWALMAWLLLGAGNLVGAWWAYVELGWGGYWAWDPVENAGLMPWLIGTAFLHIASIQRKTGMFRVWTVALILLTFNFCIFGMFLNRSDFLSSVHNYSNTGMETIFLLFLGITSLGPLFLILGRRNYLKGESKESPLISKENSFVLANILFIVATFVILLGTLLPWLSETITGTASTVEASFFNKTAAPILLLIIFLAGICVLLGWRRTLLRKLLRNSIFPLATALIMCLTLYFIGIREWHALTLFPLCFFTISTHLYDLYMRVRARSRTGQQRALKTVLGLLRNNRPYYGGMVIHLGIALIAIGIIGSSFYQSESEVVLLPGDSAEIETYTITYEDATLIPQNEFNTELLVKTTIAVHKKDSLIAKPKPESSFYYFPISEQDDPWIRENAEASIRSMPYSWFPQEDLYIVLTDWDEDGTAIFKILVNPLVSLIWIGGGVMLIGGLFAFWPTGTGGNNNFDGRYRKQGPDSTMTKETGTDPPLLFSLFCKAINL